VPGGSSSGSAVAVAAGFATAAIGSDTGGSVRIPSALCGLAGLKTISGRCSNAGTAPLAKTFDTLGPLTRTVRDAATVTAIIAGYDERDPDTWSRPAAAPAEELDRGLEGVRVGAIPKREYGGLADGLIAAYEAALETMAAAGAVISRPALPETFDEVRPRCGAMVMAEGFANYAHLLAREDLSFDPHVRARLLTGRNTSLADYLALREDRARTRIAWMQAIANVDVLATPTTPLTAPRLDEIDETSFRAALFTRAGNYLDWCAAVVPMGLVDGLPVSLQIYARPFEEALASRAAAAFERLTTHGAAAPDVIAGPSASPSEAGCRSEDQRGK
jgi:aspartyl-tRNA(Asn)/glutamyl-tRNA(Gln) amidotransferase subunit A